MTRDEEDRVLAQATAIRQTRERAFADQAEATQLRMESGKPPFAPSDLVYAARARCKCGAGVAYPTSIGIHGAWVCSTLLLSGDRTAAESLRHDGAMPFAFYEIKSENQPSAMGSTTRPKAAVKPC